MADQAPAPDLQQTGLNAVHAWFGGKSHFIILLCIFLGMAAFGICLWRKDYGGLWPILTFLGAMSGVQVTRSIKDTTP